MKLTYITILTINIALNAILICSTQLLVPGVMANLIMTILSNHKLYYKLDRV